MSKIEIVGQMRGFLAALLMLTIGILIIIPWTSTMMNHREGAFVPSMTIYTLLLIVWIVLAIAFGVTYLASRGSGLRPVAPPVLGEEQA